MQGSEASASKLIGVFTSSALRSAVCDGIQDTRVALLHCIAAYYPLSLLRDDYFANINITNLAVLLLN